MESSIGWIYFSKTHREKVGTILELLEPEGMIDELGVGTIRDAFADQMFPGISTIQTRAKYFFIVPYILWEYQKLKPAQRKNKDVTKFLYDREHEVMWDLVDKTLDYPDKKKLGIIGITKKRRKRIVRRPSAIYWNGLTKFGFMNNGGLGVDAFLKSKVNTTLGSESLISKRAIADDDQGDDISADSICSFGLKVGILDPGWQDDLNMDLNYDEADFLQNKIKEKGKGLLLAELLNDDKLYRLFLKSKNFKEIVAQAIQLNIPDTLRNTLRLSHDFSEVMIGAHIAYNIWLQFSKYKNWGKILVLDDWSKWLENLHIKMIDIQAFDMNDIIHNMDMRIGKSSAKNFTLKWWDLIRNQDCAIEETKEIIFRQEHENKKYKARLQMQHLDDVFQNQWIGLRELDYRYRNAKRILNDIKEGLKK